MADSPKEEPTFLSEEEDIDSDLGSGTVSLEEELSLASGATKGETTSTASGSLYAELQAASGLPTDERVIPNLHGMENSSADQHSETPPLSSEEEPRPQTSAKTELPCPSADSKEGNTQNVTDQSLSKPVNAGGVDEMSVDLLEGNCPLGERVRRIQAVFLAATKHSQCHGCLQEKKNQAPDILCVDCARCYCFRCSSRHKSTPACSEHTMLPVVEDRDQSSVSQRPKVLSCPDHPGAELDTFCGTCEVLVCSECLGDQHLHCLGKVPLHEYASEERELVKKCRVKYAQVMRFFSEQRRDTEERMAALNLTKQNAQGEIRKFFSSLIKACMDVEGSLLEEIETTVYDHLDLLTEQSSAWQTLQKDTQELLDMTDILHFLPNADFLPLVEASKASLSQALRDGESLAGSTPSEMSIDLTLAQSSLRGFIKRVKEIGAQALTISTHRTLTLRKVTTMSFTTADDKTDPLVTSMLLLSHNLLVAADFNNSCLKRFVKEEEVEGWNCTEVLTLKWRPYGLTKLSEKHASFSQTSKPQESQPEKQKKDLSVTDQLAAAGDTAISEDTNKEGFCSKQAWHGKQDGDDSDSVIRLAVTSPFAGCFEIVVPVSSHRRMSVVRAINEDKGFWGLGLISDHKLAVSTIASGRSYMSLIDLSQNSTQRLPLTSNTTLTPLVSPRHVLPTSPTSIIVGDHGKKAVIHVSVDGKVLFNFIGNGSQRVSHPEGLCVDSQGHVYVADSGDHSIFVLTKGGHLYSRTGSQQSDLDHPQALCMDRNSCLYVANEGGKLLNVYEVFQES